MRRVAMLSTLVCTGTLSIALCASRQPDAGRLVDAAKIVKLEKLKENLYVLKGGGGNTAVFLTDLGAVVVDTKLAGWGQPLIDKIKSITTKPVTTLINTHAHGDDTGSNESFGTAVEIVAQDNTRANMERMDAFKGGKVNFLPKLMFKDKMMLGAGKDKIELYYFGAGHTNGDAWVVFPALRVMHAGDMFAAKQLPIIDRSNGGSGMAYSDTLAKAVAATKTAVDAIITGHDGITTPLDLEEYARFNRDFRNVVVDGFDHGLSVGEVVASWKMPDAYKGYASADPERVRDDVSQIFGELSK